MTLFLMRDKTQDKIKGTEMGKIGYARVSSGSQDLKTQRELLAADGISDIRIEVGSGAKSDRPVFAALVEEAIISAQSDDAIEIVVVRLDRWGRSLPDVVNTLTRFQSNGVRFRSLTEAGVTLDGSPSSMLVITLLAAAASYERTLMMARVAEAKKAKGRSANGGRPRALTSKMVERARAYIEIEKMSVPAAASKIGVSGRTLNRYLAETVSSHNAIEKSVAT
jgi:DNA invertase Pin-like site-specific DNA recombinase